MHLKQRINLLSELGDYILSDNETWKNTKQKAFAANSWFIPEFVDLAVKNIATAFLEKNKLENWINSYQFPAENNRPLNIGVVMAGNIPLVGFHDFLSVFISGHKQTIKLSAKDNVLLPHLIQHLFSLDPMTKQFISFGEMLKGCDAYIATGSNNTGRYFDYYFGKYPHIIRRNRTSVAMLDGKESSADLEKLADDVYDYFGLGCRNVTKLFVPEKYDFVPLLDAFRKFNRLAEHNKYKNNYDYQLALLILNKKYYMTNESVILTENDSPFSPISVLHFEYYKDPQQILDSLQENQDIQCVTGNRFLQFGRAQSPSLKDYADGVDTLQFLHSLND
ncbi:MAG: acyl-CoA reductase [Bacteroidetes bacterium]|nr:acyl-CoA reductase [Bacteroidota bacterium]